MQAQAPALVATPTAELPAAATATKAKLSLQARIVMLGATSIVIGILWDISWHRTIGRDTFWTPAHMAIYLGGVLGGMTCGWLVLRTTFFATPEEKAGAVGLFGFRAPMGAWVTIWGALAMLTSAPFDDWWHNAYGLDVKILSPPHSVLALGMWGIVLGGLMLVLREQNLTPAGEPAPSRYLFVYAAGLLIVMVNIFHTEHSWPNQQRTGTFYEISAASLPAYLLATSRASKFKWGATWIALIYMGVSALAAWILPLFPGQPKLGPIWNPVRNFVTLPFPLLLIVPAIGIDLLRRWLGHDRGWVRDWSLVILAGIAFAGLFLAVQWYFSAFLISPRSENWFFATNNHWGYPEGPGDYRYKFWSDTDPKEQVPLNLRSFLLSVAFATASARVGLWLGNWMAKVRR